jgi:hypothetical protein
MLKPGGSLFEGVFERDVGEDVGEGLTRGSSLNL